MKLNVNDIDSELKDLIFTEPTAELNAELVHGQVQDFEFQNGAKVHVQYHRSGDDLVFIGRIGGDVLGHCARCLESYPFELSSDFSFILAPRGEAQQAGDDEEDVDFSFYEGDQVDLSPLVREELILALPTKPLCSESCKGLCPQCGVNLNLQSCDCTDQGGDPRLAVLRNLKVSR